MTYHGDRYWDDATRLPPLLPREPHPVRRILPATTMICARCGATFELRDERVMPRLCERCRLE